MRRRAHASSEMSDTDRRLLTLLETYAVDRQDNQNQNLSALALVGAGLVYAGTVATYLANHCSGGCDEAAPLAVLLIAPLPAVHFFPSWL